MVAAIVIVGVRVFVGVFVKVGVVDGKGVSLLVGVRLEVSVTGMGITASGVILDVGLTYGLGVKEGGILSCVRITAYGSIVGVGTVPHNSAVNPVHEVRSEIIKMMFKKRR